MIVVESRVPIELALAAGHLSCPDCEGVLAPWGYARARVLRWGSQQVWLRPRRGRCRDCGRTHVLIPDLCAPRRRDAMAIIRAAVTASAQGLSHRRIAEWPGLPLETVREWLRSVRT